MIISEQWLRDWVSVDLDAQGIADCLTNAGLEVDGVKALASVIDNLLVGRVVSVNKHPDADRLNLTKVDVGDEQLDIVCGASNVREGLLVAVAKIGAKLPNGLKIKKAKVRGIESNGMLCSATELGLEENSEGLIELDEDAQLGQRVDEYLQLDDMLIDIDLTPNRGDCLSVQGIARELKVLANGKYHPLDIDVIAPSSDENITVQLDDSKACPRYLTRVIKGLNTQANTPLWMQEKLRRSGIRSVSPVVDITNYVMLELGQPMHAFDQQKINDKIIVRQSKAGELITLLDASETKLDDDTLVIADAKGPLAIAGVMGGADSAIDDNTQSIVLEAAHFTRKAISGRARRYGLHTDSSFRFERGVDPQLPRQAMERATELVLEICGGEAGPVVEQKNEAGLTAKPAVEIRLQRLESLLGMSFQANEVQGVLKRVSDNVTDINSESWSVTPPSYRFDIELECDLVEEVARVKGYDNIPTKMPRILPSAKVASEKMVALRQLKQSLVARDYYEAITYSFIDPALHKLFSDESAVELNNPLAENMSVMRTSLLPGLVEAVKFNVNRQHERVRLFESGAIYTKNEQGYQQRDKLAGIICGTRAHQQWGVSKSVKLDYFDLKSDVTALLGLTNSQEAHIFKELDHMALHPGQSARIMRPSLDSSKDDIEVGYLGCLHPVLQKKLGLPVPCFVFELDVELAFSTQITAYKGISRFPSIKRDLSLLVNEQLKVADMLTVLHDELGDTLNQITVFDVFQGDGIELNMKSVSLSLSLQHKDKTMTDDEAQKIIEQALNLLGDRYQARLRA